MDLLSETDIRVDWETYNIEENDHQLVDVVVTYGDHFPLKDADGNELPSEAFRILSEGVPAERETNQTIASEETSMSHQRVAVSMSNNKTQSVFGTSLHGE